MRTLVIIGLALGAAVCFAFALAGCAATEEDDDAGAPDTSLFRDFLSDGKFDQAGHPVNAVTLQAETVCQGRGTRLQRTFVAADGEACRLDLRPRAFGDLIVNARLRATPARAGDVVTLAVGSASRTLTRAQVRKGWMQFSLPIHLEQGAPAQAVLSGAGNGTVEIDYFELFPSQFQLVIGPGSREYSPGAELVFERALTAPPLSLSADGVDLTTRLQRLISSGVASSTTTSFRRLVRVAVEDLLGMTTPRMQIVARSGNDSARMEVRAFAPPCEFEGDFGGKKVLLTGFQPFPADANHENVSWVAVSSLDPLALPGSQIMRLELPVEYDLAAAEVASAIDRCRPDLVVSFGQGGGAIHLEQTAYNLKDTAEVAGGVPDNRGVVFAGQPIEAAAAGTRATRLPLDDIRAALAALGESPQLSDDPGRYICNNVMFAGLGAAERLGIRAGFVHLPYEDRFPDETRARYGRVVEAVVRVALP